MALQPTSKWLGVSLFDFKVTVRFDLNIWKCFQHWELCCCKTYAWFPSGLCLWCYMYDAILLCLPRDCISYRQRYRRGACCWRSPEILPILSHSPGFLGFYHGWVGYVLKSLYDMMSMQWSETWSWSSTWCFILKIDQLSASMKKQIHRVWKHQHWLE